MSAALSLPEQGAKERAWLPRLLFPPGTKTSAWHVAHGAGPTASAMLSQIVTAIQRPPRSDREASRRAVDPQCGALICRRPVIPKPAATPPARSQTSAARDRRAARFTPVEALLAKLFPPVLPFCPMPDYRRRSAREAMSVRVDLSGAVAQTHEAWLLERRELEAVASQLAGLTEHFQRSRQAGELPCLSGIEDRQAWQAVRALADQVREGCETLVVVGAGGTALASRALLEALCPDGARLQFLDHVDPHSLSLCLERFDLRRTVFHLVSKSGETPETLAQFLLLRDLLLRELGGVDYTERLVVTTDADQGGLRQIVHDEGFRSLALPAGVADRFAVLTAAALFPAAVLGVRIDEVLAGAQWMEQRCAVKDPWRNPAALLAAVSFVLERQHRVNGLLCLPFSTRLAGLAAWAGELWVEAVRREETPGGAPVVVPWLPVARPGWDCALAAQLAAGGAGAVLSVLLTVEDHGRELPLAAAYADLEALAYLGGKSLGEVMAKRAHALALLLRQHRRPFVRLRVLQVNPFTVGQVLYLWQMVVLYLAALYGLDPFRQPVADEYRRLLLATLGRKGLEDVAAEGEGLLREQPEWIV